ncbi:hypothetical protein JCM11491_005471 [Sporobolomyces phaffii]
MGAGVHSDTDSEGVDVAHAPTVAILDSAPDDSDASDHDLIPERVGNFVLLAQHEINVAPHIRVAKWQSEKSGLSVVWADTPDLVSSFAATVVTEIFNDSGVPHTKEHLTFTSSQHYPYSNVLDSIAGPLLTQGVNAATDLDNTTYTVESASSQGLLKLIPVYLDHILFPLMDENIFKTEIFHLNAKGEEGGTVYSEMQGREGSQEDLMQLAQQQALYTFGNAYRYETGGTLAHLRKLTLKDIMRYHETAYVPQNMTVVVTGRQIDPRCLLETISRTTERDIAKAGLARGPHPQGWVRPFVGSTTAQYRPVIGQDKTVIVPYASTDTSTGSITISFVGPTCRDSLTLVALGVLGDFLAGSAHSVLRQKFVEVPQPACAGISFDIAFRDPCILTFSLDDVEQDRLSSLGGQVNLVLGQVCHERVDMREMRAVIKQQIIAVERMMEMKPDAYVRNGVLQDIIYGDEDGGSLSTRFNDVEMLEKLSEWTAQDWIDLLSEYLVQPHSVILVGTPDPRLVKEQAREEAARVAKRVQRFGPAGLARLGLELKQAEKANDYPPPASLIETYSVPSFREISWLSVDTARSNGVGQGKQHFRGNSQKVINANGADLPLFLQFDNVPSSNFVTVTIFIHGPSLPILPLFVDTFFSMPVDLASGRRLSWQDVLRKLDGDLTSRHVSIKRECLVIQVTARKDDYGKAVLWLSDVLHRTAFDVDRLRNLVNTTLEVLPSAKEDGSGIAQSAVSGLCYAEASFETQSNSINQIDLYPKLKRRLENDPQSVVRDLEDARDCFLDPRAMRVSVVGDISTLRNPSSTWLECFEPVARFPASELAPISQPRHLLTPLGERPAQVAIVYRIDNSESTYLTTLARCPDWDHPDYVALEVAVTLLSQTNGPLWNVTRTAGLCYGATISNSTESGFLSLTIYRSPDALAALAAVRSLLGKVASRKAKISQTLLAAAKSELAFATVNDESTPAKAAARSFLNTVILDRPRDFAKTYLESVELVTVDAIHRVIDAWIVRLTDPARSILGATSSPAKTSALVGGLEKLGYHVEQRHF